MTLNSTEKFFGVLFSHLSPKDATVGMNNPDYKILSHGCTYLVNKKLSSWGAWVAQSVKRLTSPQVMISRSVSSSPASGSGLMAQSLEPASDSVSPSLSAPALLALCLSLSLKINKH